MVTSRMQRFGQLPKLGTVVAPPPEPTMSGSNEPVGIIADSINSFLYNYRSTQAWNAQNELARNKVEADKQYGAALGQIAGPLLEQAQEQGRFLDMDTSMAASIIRNNPDLIKNPDSLMELFLGPEAEGPEIGTHFEGGQLHRYDKNTGEYLDAQALDLPPGEPTAHSPLGKAYLDFKSGILSPEDFEAIRQKQTEARNVDSNLLRIRAAGYDVDDPRVQQLDPAEARAALVSVTREDPNPPSWVMALDPNTAGMTVEELRSAGVNIDLRPATAESLLEGRAAINSVMDTMTSVQNAIIEDPAAVGFTGWISQMGNAVASQAPLLAELFGIEYDSDLLNPDTYSSTLRQAGIQGERLRSQYVSAAYGVALANNAGKGRLSNQDIERAMVEIAGSGQSPAALIAIAQDVKERTARNFGTRVEALTNMRYSVDIPEMPLGTYDFDTLLENMTPEQRALFE